MIALQILKIIGIILLIILALILLLILIVLFAPIHYKAESMVNGGERKFQAHARLNWICHIIRFYLDTENEKLDYCAKLLWFKVYPRPEKKEGALGERKSPETDESPFYKIKYKISNLYVTIKRIIYMMNDERDRAAVVELLLRTKKLLWHMRPRRFDANLRLGFNDPSKTGEITGIIYSFYPVYTNHLHLTPDFDEEIIDGDLELKGHLQLIFVLIAAARIYFNKDIRRLYRQIQKLRE